MVDVRDYPVCNMQVISIFKLRHSAVHLHHLMSLEKLFAFISQNISSVQRSFYMFYDDFCIGRDSFSDGIL